MYPVPHWSASILDLDPLVFFKYYIRDLLPDSDTKILNRHCSSSRQFQLNILILYPHSKHNPKYGSALRSRSLRISNLEKKTKFNTVPVENMLKIRIHVPVPGTIVDAHSLYLNDLLHFIAWNSIFSSWQLPPSFEIRKITSFKLKYWAFMGIFFLLQPISF